MSIENIIKNAESIRSHFRTKSGYPIFDIMIPLKNQDHYVTASEMVFYTEDPELLKKVENFEYDDLNSFLTEYCSNIYKLENLKKSIEVYSISESQIYERIVNYFDKNMKNGSQICDPHILKDDKLFFYKNNNQVQYINSHKDENLNNRFLENLKLGTEKYESKENPIIVLEGDGVMDFFAKNLISKEYYSKIEDIKNLTADQIDALNIFNNMVNSLFYPDDKVIPKVNIKETLEMTVVNGHIEYVIKCDDVGKCNLIINDNKINNKTLGFYDNVCKAVIELMLHVHKTKEQEIIETMNSKVKKPKI